MIATVMRPFSKAAVLAAPVAEAVFTIHSISSGKCLAPAEVEAAEAVVAFSKSSSEVAVVATVVETARTFATIWKSLSKKPRVGSKKKFHFGKRSHVSDAEATARSR